MKDKVLRTILLMGVLGIALIISIGVIGSMYVEHVSQCVCGCASK
jgi:hypothetical protein